MTMGTFYALPVELQEYIYKLKHQLELKSVHEQLLENSVKFKRINSRIQNTHSYHWLSMCGITLNSKNMKVWKYTGLDEDEETSNRDVETVSSEQFSEYKRMVYAPRNFLDKLNIIRHMLRIESDYMSNIEELKKFFGSRITGLCKLNKINIRELCVSNDINVENIKSKKILIKRFMEL